MNHERYLDLAIEEAEIARSEGSLPVGSVVVRADGQVISRGRNRALSQGDQTAHAETDAIRNAGRVLAPAVPGKMPTFMAGSGHILYTSAEPCLMCLGAILVCTIETVVWAADSVTGSPYEAVVNTGYQNERLKALKVVKEASSEHRSRSRALLREFHEKQGNVQLARLFEQP